jgi:hypothetical protein
MEGVLEKEGVPIIYNVPGTLEGLHCASGKSKQCNQGLIDSFREEGMQLPFIITLLSKSAII